MSWFLRQLVWLIHRRKREEDLQEELAFHLPSEAEDGPADGLSDEEARGGRTAIWATSLSFRKKRGQHGDELLSNISRKIFATDCVACGRTRSSPSRPCCHSHLASARRLRSSARLTR